MTHSLVLTHYGPSAVRSRLRADLANASGLNHSLSLQGRNTNKSGHDARFLSFISFCTDMAERLVVFCAVLSAYCFGTRITGSAVFGSMVIDVAPAGRTTVSTWRNTPPPETLPDVVP